ncbi:MAG: hypothetical protein EA353_01045 [Puniceicoccaceae bacterium]|nr:MAG: hypothetical protein EA353_01045 [Puniceicoccaceae bacterium]
MIMQNFNCTRRAKRFTLIGTGIALLCSTTLANPANLLNNGSFELSTGYNGGEVSQIRDWSTCEVSYGTVHDVTNVFTEGLDGKQALWVNGTLTQAPTGLKFKEGVRYLLTFSIGRPLDAPENQDGINISFRNPETDELLPDSSLFVSSEKINRIPMGTFQTFSLSFWAGELHDSVQVHLRLDDFFDSNDRPGHPSYRLDNFVLVAEEL